MYRKSISLFCIMTSIAFIGCASGAKQQKGMLINTTLKGGKDFSIVKAYCGDHQINKSNVKNEFIISVRKAFPLREPNVTEVSMYEKNLEVVISRKTTRGVIDSKGYAISKTVSSDVVFNMPYEISEGENNYKISLKYPDEIRTKPNGSIPYYVPAEKIEIDVSRRLNNISNPEISCLHKITGTIDSGYPPESILANFTRRLGSPFSSRGNRNIFRHKKANIEVTVWPFKNGSKVEYSMGYLYTVGESNNYSSQYVEDVNNEIKNIVNQ